MSNLKIKSVFSLLLVLFLAACAATTGVLPKGNGVYTIEVYRGDAGKVKLRAYQHAEKYCAEEQGGKSILVVGEKMSQDPMNEGGMSRFDLDFKCIVGPASREPAKK
ncbi:hypothetical protein [Polynucleobacter sp.]|jgi:hypothetical protein|uniref:hypothetical protein n=1 Tax=Polynucleobacter sp. TaxID=2029855 RepID=UPI0037C9D36D